jgi:hypothetical protein
MTPHPLEDRVATLEQEMAKLKQLLKGKPPQDDLPWWEKIAGSFADDLTFDEAERLGREWRRSEQDSLAERE